MQRVSWSATPGRTRPAFPLVAAFSIGCRGILRQLPPTLTSGSTVAGRAIAAGLPTTTATCDGRPRTVGKRCGHGIPFARQSGQE